MPILEGINDEKVNDMMKLRLELSKLEKEYNHTRQELFHKVRSYYHQSIASFFITEDDISKLLNKCESIKREHAMITEELMNIRPKEHSWSFRDYHL